MGENGLDVGSILANTYQGTGRGRYRLGLWSFCVKVTKISARRLPRAVELFRIKVSDCGAGGDAGQLCQPSGCAPGSVVWHRCALDTGNEPFLLMLMRGMNLDRNHSGCVDIALGLAVDDAIIAIEMMLGQDGGGLGQRSGCLHNAWTVNSRAHAVAANPGDGCSALCLSLCQSGVVNNTGNIFLVFGVCAAGFPWFVRGVFTPWLGPPGLKALLKEIKSAATRIMPRLTTPRLSTLSALLIAVCVRYAKSVVLAKLSDSFVLSCHGEWARWGTENSSSPLGIALKLLV